MCLKISMKINAVNLQLRVWDCSATIAYRPWSDWTDRRKIEKKKDKCKVNITQHIRSAVSKWPWEHPGASAILVEVTAEIWELLLGREPGALNRIALSRAIKEDLFLTETFKNWGLLWNTHWIFNTHFSVLYYTVLDISEISHFLPFTVLFECSSHSTFYLDI